MSDTPKIHILMSAVWRAPMCASADRDAIERVMLRHQREASLSSDVAHEHAMYIVTVEAV